MRCPVQGATGGWVMPGLVLQWFPFCEFSLFDTCYGYFSGSLGSWSQCFHSKGSGLDLWSGKKVSQVVCLKQISKNAKSKMKSRQMAVTKSGK